MYLTSLQYLTLSSSLGELWLGGTWGGDDHLLALFLARRTLPLSLALHPHNRLSPCGRPAINMNHHSSSNRGGEK